MSTEKWACASLVCERTKKYEHFQTSGLIASPKFRTRAMRPYKMQRQTFRLHEIRPDFYESWKVVQPTIKIKPAKGYSWEGICNLSREEIPQRKTFGVSMTGIEVKKEQISIDSERLNSNIFYLFSYENEKYVARKSDGDVIEIFEVIE